MTSYPLEPDRDEMAAMGRAAVRMLADFVGNLPDAPASDTTGAAADLVPLLLEPPPEGPGELDALLDQVRQAARPAIEAAGPRYLGYIPGGGLFSSAVAELLARGHNRYTGFEAFAPALVAMEESVLRWLSREFRLPTTSQGLVTTGGSIAALTAIVAARHDRLGEDIDRGTLYVTAHTHRSVEKAARVAGLRAANVRTVPTDRLLRMDPEAAADAIAADRAAGLEPFLLVGTAGTTDTGAIDPLPELGSLAHREGLWFHVDAAYGGFFQLTERGRTRLSGIGAADSLVLDPHKGLFVPYGTGILLVRDGAHLAAAFSGDAHYLQDVGAGDAALPNYAHLGPELTRDFRGLRLWLPLQLHGVGAFREALDEKLDLAVRAYADLATDRHLVVPWEPELTTVAFRMAGDEPDGAGGDGTDGDGPTRRLLERANATGRVLLSSTRIGGRYMVRLSILSHRTHAADVAEAVEIIRTAAAEVQRADIG